MSENYFTKDIFRRQTRNICSGYNYGVIWKGRYESSRQDRKDAKYADFRQKLQSQKHNKPTPSFFLFL